MSSLSATRPDPLVPSVAARTSLFPASLTFDLQSASCEQLERAAVGWDVRYLQLGAGHCRGRLVGIHTAQVQLCLEAWPLSMLKLGRSPRGAVTFVVPIGRSGLARVQGRPCAPGDVTVLQEGEPLECRSTGPVRLASVSIERDVLERHLRTLSGLRLAELRLQGRLRALRTDAAAFRHLCLRLVERAVAHPRLLRDPGFARSLELRLVRALFSGYESAQESDAPTRGHALARRTEAWLRENLGQPATIATLCAALGASERTLHDAFREHLGTTPKAYLKALRLNAARHDLLRGAARTRVTDVALDWGFGHFGWFSQDYRRLFGETPSHTLQRGRARQGQTPEDLPLLPRWGPDLSPAVGIR